MLIEVCRLIACLHLMGGSAVIAVRENHSRHRSFWNVEDPVEMQAVGLWGSLPYTDIFPFLALTEI